jgi:transposase
MISPAVARARARAVIEAVRRREFPYLPRPRPRIRWSLYDKAQTHELPDMLALIERSVDQLDLPPPRADRRGGRPPVPLADLVKALLLQSYRQVANRPAEGDLRAMGAALGLRRKFSYKSLERAYSHPGLLRALEELLELTNRPVRGHETIFAVDGSGFSTSVQEHYRTYRARVSARRGPAALAPEWRHLWVFNIANVGVRYGLIAAWTSRMDRDGREIDAFAKIFDQTRTNHPDIHRQLADSGYWARWVIDLLTEHGVEARIFPRRDLKLAARGSSGWIRAHWGLVVDPQRWMSEYHQRSRVESMWSALKCRTPGKTRKRRPERLVAEGWLRAVVYNLRRLCYLAWLERDELEFFRIAGQGS